MLKDRNATVQCRRLIAAKTCICSSKKTVIKFRIMSEGWMISDEFTELRMSITQRDPLRF